MVSFISKLLGRVPAPAAPVAAKATPQFDYKKIAATGEPSTIWASYLEFLKRGDLGSAAGLRKLSEATLRDFTPVIFLSLIDFCRKFPDAANKTNDVREEMKALLAPLVDKTDRELFMAFMHAHQYDLGRLILEGNPTFSLSAADVATISRMRYTDDTAIIKAITTLRIDPTL